MKRDIAVPLYRRLSLIVHFFFFMHHGKQKILEIGLFSIILSLQKHSYIFGPV